jgi:nucleotide-binding universal stress UspA family protein
MKSFEKAMVGLDMTEMDEILIKKVAYISQIMKFKKLYLIHVARDLSLPEEIRKAYPDLLAPVDETIQAEIKTLLKNEKELDPAIEIEILVLEGSPLETFLRTAKIKDVDLIIMGRKFELDGSGTLSMTLAQKAPCSVLFLTETGPIAVPQKVMIPLDFSEHTHLSFEFADKLHETLQTDIVGLHIYEVPTGYYKTGKSFDEFAEIMVANAKKDYEKFLKKYNHTPFECLYLLKKNGNMGRHIIQTAKDHGVNLILMGSRGRSNSAAILLGSTAEKLIYLNNEIPMIIFKNKGETMSFLDALMKL